MTIPEGGSARAALAGLDDGPEKDQARMNAEDRAVTDWEWEHPDRDWTELSANEREEYRATLALRDLGVW